MFVETTIGQNIVRHDRIGLMTDNNDGTYDIAFTISEDVDENTFKAEVFLVSDYANGNIKAEYFTN